MGFQSDIYGDKDADLILLQMVDKEEAGMIDQEISHIIKDADLRTARAFAWVMNRI